VQGQGCLTKPEESMVHGSGEQLSHLSRQDTAGGAFNPWGLDALHPIVYPAGGFFDETGRTGAIPATVGSVRTGHAFAGAA
jgi:hypothetical protein